MTIICVKSFPVRHRPPGLPFGHNTSVTYNRHPNYAIRLYGCSA